MWPLWATGSGFNARWIWVGPSCSQTNRSASPSGAGTRSKPNVLVERDAGVELTDVQPLA